VTLAVTAAVVLIIVGWVIALVLFKAGETVDPPRTLTATTTAQG
jgi:hypothetical protein